MVTLREEGKGNNWGRMHKETGNGLLTLNNG